MSIEKNINSRIVHKHDIESNWIKATNFIPKQGEIIIYDVDDNYSYPRFKIGDGLTLVNDLPFTIIQSDQNQNDETALDFIKNRLAWEEPSTYGITVLDKDISIAPSSINGVTKYVANTGYLLSNDNRTGCKNFIKSAEGTLFEINVNGQLYTKSLEYKKIQITDFSEEYISPRALGSLDEDICIFAWYEAVDGDEGDCYGYVIIFKDAPSFSSGNITIKEVAQPITVHKLDPKYYDRLGGTNEACYGNTLINTTITPNIEGELGIRQFEIPVNSRLFKFGEYYAVTIDGVEFIAQCYFDDFLGNPMMLSDEGVLTDDPIGITTILKNDGGYSLSGRYFPGDFSNANTVTLVIQEYFPLTIQKIDHQYYDSPGYFSTLWEIPEIKFIAFQDAIEGAYTGLFPYNILQLISKLDLNLPINITFDGIDYKCLFDQELYVAGNLSMIDSSFEDTGEPFFLGVNDYGIVIGVLDRTEHTIASKQIKAIKIHEDLINIPLATIENIGGVAPEAKEETDIQPVTIDENGKLWTEPTSNTVVRDDDNGNVVLISLATQNHENIVTDDGDGNVEVQSTSMYNPFPGIENAAVGQTVEIAEVDSNGFPTKWNTIDAGANSNIFIITMEIDPITGQHMASATPAEIYQQVIENKIVLMPVEGLSCSLMECSETETSLIALIPNTENLFFGIITIAEDRTVTLESDMIDFTQFITTSQYNQDKTLMINELNNKITAPINVEVGQVLSVKTVNTNGVPTAWEAITLSSGGASTTSIPTPTAADAGKFLRVSSEGLYILENMTNAMEVSF